jgi:cytochrome c-type biogenesis protein
VWLDPDQDVSTTFRTIGVPETFLIDREGVLAHRWIGEFDPGAPEVAERIEALLEG